MDSPRTNLYNSKLVKCDSDFASHLSLNKMSAEVSRDSQTQNVNYYYYYTTTNPSPGLYSADDPLPASLLLMKQHQGVKYISLVSIDTMHGICFFASKPGELETDSNSTATMWFTLVMMCRSSNSFPYLLIMSHNDWINHDPVIVFLHE